MFIQKRLLIIDEQTEFITACEQWLGREEFIVQGATSAEQALPIVRQNTFDLVIFGLSLAVASEHDLLQAFTKYHPHIPIIICNDEDILPPQAAAKITHQRPVSFLQKPCQPEMLQEAAGYFFRQYTTDHVRGNLRDLTLISLITTNCNEGNTAALEVWFEGQRATIFFDMGQLVHAETVSKTGEAALYEVIGWEGGDFVMYMHQSPPTKTIFSSWSKVLLEGLRLLDEKGFDEEGMAVDEVSSQPVGTFMDMGEEGDEVDWSEMMEMEDPLLAPTPTKSTEIDEETQTKIEVRLEELNRELSLRCIIFANRSGRLLYWDGNFEQSRVRSLAALIAGSFSADSEIADMLSYSSEKTQEFQQSLQEGDDFSLYTAHVSPGWVLAVVFEPNKTNLGLARQFTRQAAEELEVYLAEAEAKQSTQEDMSTAMDESFRQEVGDALGDLFG